MWESEVVILIQRCFNQSFGEACSFVKFLDAQSDISKHLVIC